MGHYDDIKAECYEANLLLPEYKLVDLTFGNVSVAEPECRVFAIKLSGVDYRSMKVDDMVVVDFEGKLVEAPCDPHPIRRLTSGYSKRSPAFDRSCTLTRAMRSRSLKPAEEFHVSGTTHADYFYGEVPVTRPMTTEEIQSAYEWETGNVIVERFQHLNPTNMCAVLVYGQGPFVWGPTGKKAVENALALEIVAEMALKAIQLNPQVQPVSSHLRDKHFLRKHEATAYYGQG